MNKIKKNLIENAVVRLQAQASTILENSGFNIDITTLTGIRQKLTEQKFYETRPSDYMPVVVGESAYMDQQLVYKENYVGGDFEEGLHEPGSNSSKNPRVEANIDDVIVKRHFWSKESNYNILELAQAAAAGNWSLVESKERALVKNWQLGI